MQERDIWVTENAGSTGGGPLSRPAGACFGEGLEVLHLLVALRAKGEGGLEGGNGVLKGLQQRRRRGRVALGKEVVDRLLVLVEQVLDKRDAVVLVNVNLVEACGSRMDSSAARPRRKDTRPTNYDARSRSSLTVSVSPRFSRNRWAL